MNPRDRDAPDRPVVPPPIDREVEDEFAFHLDMRVRELIAAGRTEAEARDEALRRFGDIERVKADCRDLGTGRDVRMNRRQTWDEIVQDTRYAIRQLLRVPSFAVITILTLAIAIGANTAVFSVWNAVVLAPLPYPDADELTMVWARYLPASGFDIDKFALSGPEYLDYRDISETMESVAAFGSGSITLTGDGADAERIRVARVSGEFAGVLGVEPTLGRWLNPEETLPDAVPATVLGHDLWVSRFGADPEIIGRSVLMNGQSTEVVGVMPQGFEFPADSRAWLSLGLDRSNEGGRASHGYFAVGRRLDGVSQADVDAELEVIRGRWEAEHEHNVAHYLWAQGLRTEIVGDSRARLVLLMTAVGLVLLIACANIANLLLARGERRHAEIAVRRTLGAGRGRITRQLATESLVLAAVAGVLGLLLAWLGVRGLLWLDAEALPRLDGIQLDGRVLAFTAALSATTAVLFGVVPALLAGRRATPGLASSATRAVGAGRRTMVLRRLLVSSEVGLSLVVVILAGLVVRSFDALSNTDPRFDPTNVVTFSLTLPTASYPNDAQVPAEYADLLDRLRTVPGVTSASMITNLPFGGTAQWDFELEGRGERTEGEVARNAGISHVDPDYFSTMGIPVLEGRRLRADDRRGGPLVAVVSETMASRFWPGESALGKRFGYPQADTVPWVTVVGLVPDPVTSTVDAEPYPHVYVPHVQGGIATYFVPRSMQVALRAGLEPAALMPAIRSTVSTFDSDLPLYSVGTMEETVSASLAGPRVTTNLLAVFASIAMILALVGIYGVISYSVAGRTREIGVRVALGAERSAITRMILVEGTRPILAGIVVGVIVATFATRLVENMLYGIEPTDPLTFSLVPLALLFVGGAASWLPAVRATRVAPTEALRE